MRLRVSCKRPVRPRGSLCSGVSEVCTSVNGRGRCRFGVRGAVWHVNYVEERDCAVLRLRGRRERSVRLCGGQVRALRRSVQPGLSGCSFRGVRGAELWGRGLRVQGGSEALSGQVGGREYALFVEFWVQGELRARLRGRE